MDFRSDNTAGAAPEILDALSRANAGKAAAYGEDGFSRAIEDRIAALFECEASVFLMATGTGANSVALAAMTPPWGAVFCHPQAHVHQDECGAPEFYTGGAKMIAVADRDGKIAISDIEAVWATLAHGVHNVQPAAISLSQTAETGRVYRPDELAGFADFAHRRGLKLHVDGARFANALVHLGCSPAEASWKAGVDILCFGASKNGAFAAEAVICFDPHLADTIAFRRKRGGHLLSKMRFIAAQFEGYLSGDLWLRNARHANAMARRLAAGLGDIGGARLAYPTEANEVFVALPASVIAGLEADGAQFYRWGGAESTTLRLVCAFDTPPEAVDQFLASARKHAGECG
ncbi:MAG: low specificity L-threonine aldolase [Alphaproteobacteria bacterium]|nr:low specificity L-threonine aldolase [Alphaproteobacteria bacterium]